MDHYRWRVRHARVEVTRRGIRSRVLVKRTRTYDWPNRPRNDDVERESFARRFWSLCRRKVCRRKPVKQRLISRTSLANLPKEITAIRPVFGDYRESDFIVIHRRD